MGPKLVVLGAMSTMPLAGPVWQTVQYLVGFERLGFETYYVEAHGVGAPRVSMPSPDQDTNALAASFISAVMKRFDLQHRWAFQALDADGRCYGLSRTRLQALYRQAAALINLHGSTIPQPEHLATGRLVYLKTDPVSIEIAVHNGDPNAVEHLAAHQAFFSFGENYGRDGCKVPVSDRFAFKPTRQPLVLDFWPDSGPPPAGKFTTIGNWVQRPYITLDGEPYYWSKHLEFLKFIKLPKLISQEFELSLGRIEPADVEMLRRCGWRVRDAPTFTADLDAYREYIANSRGELTVAKEQNVRLRSGWFSDRSATYLALGRPVITQDTGFGRVLPTGEGLFAFTSLTEILEAVESINSDVERHGHAARRIAREHFSHDVVLGRLLDELGLRPRSSAVRRRPGAFKPGLVLTPVSKHPTELEPATVKNVLRLAPARPSAPSLDRLPVSVIVVTQDNLIFNKLCLESLLADDDGGPVEIIVVDNRSSDGTAEYLAELAERDPRVQSVFNRANRGFATATNQGLRLAGADHLLLLNNDTMVSPGWLRCLLRHLADASVGLVGPVTNHASNEARVDSSYDTYAEFLVFAEGRARFFRDRTLDVPALNMYCVALRRDVYEEIGPLDERFEVGMFEDDDYARRVMLSGRRVVCAEGVFVHHFGGASLGRLVQSGRYARVFQANRRRFEQKWGITWQAGAPFHGPHYRRLRQAVRELVVESVPEGSTVLLASKGDPALLELDGRTGWHFPRGSDGAYAGHYPAHSVEAIAHLESLRALGAEYLVFPSTALWWLESYSELEEHLRSHYREAARSGAGVVFEVRDRRRQAHA